MDHCEHCDWGKEKDGKRVAVHEDGCPEGNKQKFTSPFDNELCPKCRTMFRSHVILNKKIFSCGDCGMHFTPKAERDKLKELCGKIKWKSKD